MDALILASLVVPCGLALLAGLPRSGELAFRLMPWAPLPALALVAFEPAGLDLPWLLTGVSLGFDAAGRVFLLLTALIWLACGWFTQAWLAADGRRARFAFFFLLTQAGNFGACLALDAVSFYLFFALMSFAAYGLVVHEGTPEARRAGRVYLVLAVAGEMLILSGLLLAIGLAPTHPGAAACLVLGFGVKTGLPLLHVSLPLAYAAAPIPAAAVLAGAMIKAGVLGWLRFLPLGEAALAEAGSALLLLGALAIVYGVGVGLAQRQPGALLAYSSISQMGYFAAGIGAGLMIPALWPLLAPVLILYAVHHALAKAALFLGLGIAQRGGAKPWVLAGLALPALALAGAPFTSGMLAKLGLKSALAGLPAPWAAALPALLALGALGTALLMARLLWLVRRAPPATNAGRVPVSPWLLLLVGVAGLAPALASLEYWQEILQPGTLLAAGWPILAALALAMLALRLGWRAPAVPPGDLLLPVEGLLAALAPNLKRLRPPVLPPLPLPRVRLPLQFEVRLRAWPLAGLLWLALLGAFFLLLAP